MSVRLRAHLMGERLDVEEGFAILDIDIEEVKNDIVYRIVIESGIAIHARERYRPWYEAAMAELESLPET